MANRQHAVPARVREGAGENTARVVMHKSAVPGWFWGLLGFLSVLAVGFGALLFAAKNGLFAAVAPAAATAPAAAVLPVPAPQGGPQIEPFAPAAAPALPPAEPRPRPASHPIKLARSPAPSAHAGVIAEAKPAASVAKVDPPVADATAAKKPEAKPAPAADDDQVVHVHHTTASDTDDDDDDN